MKRTKFSKHCHELFAFAKKDTNVNKYFKEKKQTKTQHIKFLEMKEKWKTVFFLKSKMICPIQVLQKARRAQWDTFYSGQTDGQISLLRSLRI